MVWSEDMELKEESEVRYSVNLLCKEISRIYLFTATLDGSQSETSVKFGAAAVCCLFAHLISTFLGAASHNRGTSHTARSGW